MIEIIAALSRWSQLTANLIIFGCCVFFAITMQHRSLSSTHWIERIERKFPWMAGIILLGLIGILATTTSEATGIAENLWNPYVWFDIVQQTQIGHIWIIRTLSAAFLLAITLYFIRLKRERWHYILVAIVASLPIIAGTFMSHSSADEMSFASIAPYALHILLAGTWFGALPAILLLLFSDNAQSDAITATDKSGYLHKFSQLAMPVMLLLLATGVIVTDRLVAGLYHTLVASNYGWLLNLKLSILAIILLIAYQVRNTWLPIMTKTGRDMDRQHSIFSLKKWVRIEFILALLLVLIATILANTLPAKHSMVQNWPYPFRFSFNATDDPIAQEIIRLGMALFLVALGAIWLGIRSHWSKLKLVVIPGVLVLSASAIALPLMILKSYPETYLKPSVPFDAVSISNGMKLFAENCVNCHGYQGKGTGNIIDPKVKDPTDLLTEPHTASYTVGNTYHYLTHGISGKAMPGFAETLSEEDRWDLINFLHALSRGFDARLLGSMIVPEMPTIGSPIFNYAVSNGSGGNLKDFRLQKNVLLVLFSWPQSKQRMYQLATVYDEIRNLDTEILAVPNRALSEEELQQILAIVPFPIVTEGWSEIKDSYWLYRRVRTVPDLSGKGMFPGHIEFMTDRFGYLRARWVAQFEGFGWQSIDALTLQLTQLNREGEIMPPPGEHAH